MNLQSVDHFTSWLVKELSPICDAEPAALAKYVLALIKKPDKTDEEMRKFCQEQLEVFLQGHTKRFVEKMFSTLGDNSYIPPRKEPEPSVIIEPTPTTSVIKEQKKEPESRKNGKENEKSTTREKRTIDRVVDKEEPRRKIAASAISEKRKEEAPRERDMIAARVERPPRKRISPPVYDNKAVASVDTREGILHRDENKPQQRDQRDVRSEYGIRRRSRSPRDRRGGGGGGRQMGRRSPPDRHRTDRRRTSRSPRSRSRSNERGERRERRIDDDRRRLRCRDFDEKGYCMRGEKCLYDHGPDPVVVDDSALDKMVKLPPKGPPNFSIPPPGYNTINPPPPGVEGIYSAPPPSAIPEAYNPEAPSIGGADFSMPPPPLPINMNAAPWRPTPYSVMSAMASQGNGYELSAVSAHDGPSNDNNIHIGMRGGLRGRGRGGLINRYQANTRSGDGKTIKVCKIPPIQNNISKLNEHFAAFGSIVNMQVHAGGDPEVALITYSSHGEAMAAMKSPNPVLNNRFIKVLWHSESDQNNANKPARFEGNGSIAGQTLSSGVQVEKPISPVPIIVNEKPKVASLKEAKFVNPAIRMERETVMEAKRKYKLAKQHYDNISNLFRLKQEFLMKLIEQQKVLVAKARDASAAEKPKLLSLTKVLSDKMKDAKAEINPLTEKLNEYTREMAELDTIVIAGKKKEREEKEKLEAKGEKEAKGEPEAGKPLIVSHTNLMKRSASQVNVDDDDTDGKKECAVVNVTGFDIDDIQLLIDHMEFTFGALLDMVTETNDSSPVAKFTFKFYDDAKRAVESGTVFKDIPLQITWSNPDSENHPDSQMTANQLLATIPQSESDEEQ